MALVKNNQIVEDQWCFISGEDVIEQNTAIVVTLEHWNEAKENLLSKTEKIGVLLKSDERAEDIEDDLKDIKLIALDYPTFMDGRAYSQARLLRERYKFDGEIRAVGNVLQDQLLYMERCGIDAFEIQSDDKKALEKWLAAQSEMSVFYQPTADGRKTALSLRQLKQQAQQQQTQ